MADFGDGSDGAVNFTTSTKTYGNLTLNVDYKVSGNYLYLKVDKVYNFTNFTLGSGTELRPWAASNKGTAIYIKANNSSTVSGVVRASFYYAYAAYPGTGASTSWSTGEDEGTLSTPGVANGGSAGKGGDAADDTDTESGGSGGAQSFGMGGGGGGGACHNISTVGGGAGGNGGSGGYSPIGGVGPWIGDRWHEDGLPGSQSGGGGGGAAIANDSDWADGGDGSGTRNVDGTDADVDSTPNNKVSAGGGGGCGGLAGYTGLHYILKSRTLVFTGTINTSGTNGGNGSNGGDGMEGGGIAYGSGGGGAGAGGGGSAGNIKFEYIISRITDTGTKTMNRGNGGSAGTGGIKDSSTGDGFSENGTNGNVGSNGNTGSYSGVASSLPGSMNIGNVWKDGVSIKLALSGSWKEVISAKKAIGGVWKTLF